MYVTRFAIFFTLGAVCLHEIWRKTSKSHFGRLDYHQLFFSHSSPSHPSSLHSAPLPLLSCLFVSLLPFPSLPPTILLSHPLPLSRFAHQVHRALRFDWLMLFLHGSVHQETVNRALRILVQLLSDSTLLQRFHEGDIFGGWVYGFETISPEMCKLQSSQTKRAYSSGWGDPAVFTCLLANGCHLTRENLH